VIGTINPADRLARLSEVIGKERDKKQEVPSKLRQERRAGSKKVA